MARARSAMAMPILPSPMMPSVLPRSSTPVSRLAGAPVGCPHRGVAGRDPPGKGVEQGEGVLGRRDRVAGRGVDDDDAGPGGGLQVHVVDADPGPADDDEPTAGGDELGVGLDLAADDERVVVADDRAERLARQADPLVDLVVGPEELEALAGQ